MDFLDWLCCFVRSVKQPVDFTGVHFAGHCNQVDVIPILKWTQVCYTWGFCGFMLDLEMVLLDFPGLRFCRSW